MKFLLIHGFATKVNYDLGFWKYPPTTDFLAWGNAIFEGDAKIFSWGIKQDKNWKNILNVLQYWDLYKREKSLAANKYQLLELKKTIDETNPEIIVCHSMGAFLFENYCELYDLPISVKKIVFNQADVRDIPNLEKQLKANSNVILENYYCSWDQALVASTAVNLSNPVGLFGLKIKKELESQIKNIFWRLNLISLNPHIDAINSQQFKKCVSLDKSK